MAAARHNGAWVIRVSRYVICLLSVAGGGAGYKLGLSHPFLLCCPLAFFSFIKMKLEGMIMVIWVKMFQAHIEICTMGLANFNVLFMEHLG